MVEEIRTACKEKKTSIWAIEKKLGFGNGTIRRWDENAPSFDRLSAVASELGVLVEDIAGGKKEKPTPVSESGQIPKYDLLNDENRAMIDGLIAKLLTSQSDGQQ